ncbi:MAG: M20/M25/M40 family metallo-hydrolase [Thermoproteota archaeon]|nr:M20/M25/M40 family metallo-hydrolase [Thermoproteota archaeon]
MVSSSYAIELLRNALDLYSPSRSEAALANMIRDRCVNELGFEQVNIDNVGNVIATKGTGEPCILLCGHMDTVPGPVPVRIDNGYIYGRGASDAKSPLIAMLLAASEFPKQTGTVIFAGVVDEEGNATGIKHLVKSNIEVDYAVFGEPSGVDNITIAYKGRLEIRLIIDVGNSAHASAPWLAKNSIEEIYDFWAAIKNEIGHIGSSDSNAKSISCSLTEITGGSSHNVTPQKCKATIDIRVPLGTTCDNVIGAIDCVIKKVAENKGIRAKYRIEDKTEPFEADHTSPLVRALLLAVLDVRNKRPMLLRKTGTGDMNVLGHNFKIPVITYGPGDPHASHTADERVDIEEYVASIEVYKRALFHMSRLHHLKKKKKE